jgi:ribosomal protein L40E
MLSSCKVQRQLIVVAILLFSASSTFLLNEPVQAGFHGVNGRIALAGSPSGSNHTCETTLTSFTTVYNTTTLTQTTYLTSTSVILVGSTTTVSKKFTTSVTAFTNTTNTVLTTQTTTETSTTYTTTVLSRTISTTMSTTSTNTITIVDWSVEVLIASLALAFLAILLVPRVRTRRLTGKVCPQCGYSNPPYARSFCIRCGSPLESPKT